MKAIVITGVGGPEVLELRDVPVPEPRGAEVRVRVRACGLNRADLMQCRGLYPAPPGVPADIPGLEFAGEVDAIGPECTGPLKPGDRVFGIVAGGGQAEFVLTNERAALPIPANLDYVEAAAVPEVFITAHDALESQGGLRPGEAVLIHAVGSGVGTAALQIAKAMGCMVLGTSRTEEKLRRAAKLGLDLGINTRSEALLKELRERINAPGLGRRGDHQPGILLTVIRKTTAGRGVDVIIDLIGAVALEENLEVVATGGRIVVVGLLGGRTGTIDLLALMSKRARLIGTVLRARPIEEKIAATRAFAARVLPWLESGLVRPVVDSVFAFEDVRAAQERLESNLGFGKVVLRL
jgi:NADPH:quinone reductase-like Zn-dependent oxidoreductase